MNETGHHWLRDAACRACDPEMFFPSGGPHQVAEQVERAQQVCDGCPVQTDCLEWAVTTGADNGIWGGHTEEDRQALRRRRRRDRTPTSDDGAAKLLRLQAASRRRTANAANALLRSLPSRAS